MSHSSIYIVFSDYFNEQQENGGSGYMLIGLAVPLRLLYELYNTFIKDGIDPIENVSKDKKCKYFAIAQTFYTDTPTLIKASKAAYVLDLITSNE